MRAAPAVGISVTRFGVWRTAVGAVLALVWLVVVAWGVSHARATGGMLPPAAVGLVGLAALAAATWLAARLVAVPPFDLRWDGRSWFVGTRSTPADAVAGDLRATIDLGSWLLLHFTPERPAGARPPPRWLPVQRGGAEASWHALRCAVHSPRPVPAPPAAVD